MRIFLHLFRGVAPKKVNKRTPATINVNMFMNYFKNNQSLVDWSVGEKFLDPLLK